MQRFDFSAPAELYASRGMRAGRHPVRYRRFDSSAEAIRFAVEELGEDMLRGTDIESEDARLDGMRIRALYLSAEYPLKRVSD